MQNKEIAIEFLKTVLNGVEKILEENPGGFKFSSYVSETKKENGNLCGTVCCMEGWLPKIFPDKVEWRFVLPVKVCVIGSCYPFTPSRIGVPISNRLWNALTLFSAQNVIEWPERDYSHSDSVPIEAQYAVADDFSLSDQATFEEVKRVWLHVIDTLERGNIYDYLIKYDTVD